MQNTSICGEFEIQIIHFENHLNVFKNHFLKFKKDFQKLDLWFVIYSLVGYTFCSGHFFSCLQPFVRYLEISAPVSRAKNRVTCMSYRSQRVNIEVWKISNCSKMCFFVSFCAKNDIFGEIWWFFEIFFEIWGHVNPLKTIRFWDFRVFLLRRRKTLTANIFGTTIAMDL